MMLRGLRQGSVDADMSAGKGTAPVTQAIRRLTLRLSEGDLPVIMPPAATTPEISVEISSELSC